MRILIVGGGAREHALAWGLSKSRLRPRILVTPGNGGTAGYERADLKGRGLAEYVAAERIDLTVIGPEQPLVDGVVDRIRARGGAVVGPTAAAARLEGSKAFAKAFMERHDIPTAAHRTFRGDEYEAAAAYVEARGEPVVVKASGLAAGKGVLMCASPEEGVEALRSVMQDDAFGEAGDEVVVEALMEGEEASVFVLTDGETYQLLASAQDHKRIGEGDTGLNTGGMGAYAPAPLVTAAVMETVRRMIIEPTLAGMRAEGHPYTGVLYVGVMLTKEGPKVVEYNCRLGDPETQAVLPLVEGDLAEIFLKLATGRLDEAEMSVAEGAAACVVMASEGYPGAYPKGRAIAGIEAAESVPGVHVFHAGTRWEGENLVTSGGRVLSVVARAATLGEALDRAYEAADCIHFEGAYLRRDIGQKGLVRLEGS